VTFAWVFYQEVKGKLTWNVSIPFAIHLVANLIFTPIQFRIRNLPLDSLAIASVLATIV